MRPEYKVARSVFSRDAVEKAQPDAPRLVLLHISFVPGVHEESFFDKACSRLSLTWGRALRGLGGDILGRSRKSLTVRVPPASLHEAIPWFALEELVHGVELSPARVAHNAGAQFVLQSGSEDRGTPLWDRGLNGTGELVAVSDTGADLTNCLLSNDEEDPWGSLKPCLDCTTADFWRTSETDADGEFSYDDSNLIDAEDVDYLAYCEFTSPECTTVSEDRKVVGYMGFGNGTYRDEDGHGSHCAGSVAGFAAPGSSSDTINAYQGMAPGAKLLVVDFTGPSSAMMSPPGNTTFQFDWGRLMGARIHSASWGSSALSHLEGYTETTAQIDDHVFTTENLVLFAASNDGALGYGSIGPEAQAKNVLTVGALRFPSVQEEAYTNFTHLSYVTRAAQQLCGGKEEMSVEVYCDLVQVIRNCTAGSRGSPINLPEECLQEDEYSEGGASFDESWGWYAFERCEGQSLERTDDELLGSRAALSEYLCGDNDTDSEGFGARLSRNPDTFCCGPEPVCSCLASWEYDGEAQS
eukprot:gene28471-35304_t